MKGGNKSNCIYFLTSNQLEFKTIHVSTSNPLQFSFYSGIPPAGEETTGTLKGLGCDLELPPQTLRFNLSFRFYTSIQFTL